MKIQLSNELKLRLNDKQRNHLQESALDNGISAQTYIKQLIDNDIQKNSQEWLGKYQILLLESIARKYSDIDLQAIIAKAKSA